MVVLDRKGNKLRSLKQVLDSPRAVAVDEDGYIYLVELNNSIVRKIDRQMNVIAEKKMAAGHYCVAVVKDEIMTCEQNNTGTIQVYNKNLEHVRGKLDCSRACLQMHMTICMSVIPRTRAFRCSAMVGSSYARLTAMKME